jgi:hypothetical protein
MNYTSLYFIANQIIESLSANINMDHFRLFSCLLQVVLMDQLNPSFASYPCRIEALKELIEEKLRQKLLSFYQQFKNNRFSVFTSIVDPFHHLKSDAV